MLVRLVLALLPWLVLCHGVAPATAQGPGAVYVDPTGNDTTGDGTAGNPFRSVQRGHDVVTAGGTVHVRAGTYPFAVAVSKSVRIARDGPGTVNLGPPDVGTVTVSVAASDVTLLDLGFVGGAARGVERSSGDRLRIERCAFTGTTQGAIRLSAPGGTGHQLIDCAVRDVRAQPAAVGVVAQAATGLVVQRLRIVNSDLGVRLDGCAQARLERCVFLDLFQSALQLVASPDAVVADCRFTRVGHFATPAAWAQPSEAFAAVCLTAASARALVQRCVIEDCGGYVGKNLFRGSATTLFDGCFALGIEGSIDARVVDCALHRNRFGGVWVGGVSTGLTLERCNLVGNGTDNDPGEDVAVYSDGPTVTATDCFWGLPGGPTFDGAGFGNGTLGATVTTTPLAVAPFDSAAFAVVESRDVPVADRGVALAAADLTGDGWIEVIALGDRAGAVEVHVNGPAGFVAREVATLAGARPVAVATGMLDGDALRDVLVADDVNMLVHALLGDGTGRLPVARTVAVLRRPVRLVSGQLDGQPGDDAVVACLGDPFGPGGLSLLRNDGAGNLTATTVAGAVMPAAVELLDLDADGDLDLVVFDLDPAGPALRSFTNSGAGVFTAGFVRAFDAHPVVDASLAVFDQDGGPLDLALATFQLTPLPGVSRVRLLRGDGAGGFGAAIPLRERSGPLELRAGRLGGAASASLFALDRGRRQVLTLGPLASDGSASFPYAQVFGDAPLAMAVAPLTNRTTTDLAVVETNRGVVAVERGRRAAGVTTYGTGCAGVSGVPRVQWASLPQLGSTTFALGFDNAAPNTAGVLALGALPLDLQLPGGCRLLVDLLLSVGSFSDATGAGALPLAIPDSPTLLGSELVGQWFVLDPAGGLFGALSMTSGLRVVVGG
jgi:hypothetical protein